MRSIKSLALQAKQRLKGNKVSTITYNYGVVEFKKLNYDEDKIFYDKVSAIDNIDQVENPISLLIDYNYYNSLTNMTKEKYFFDLLDKYRNYVEKLESDRKIDIV